MKCIKALRDIANTVKGTILRLKDKEADLRVDSGNWIYAPKSEWKKSKVVEKVETTEEPNKKLEKRMKLKTKQK